MKEITLIGFMCLSTNGKIIIKYDINIHLEHGIPNI